jgi:hypothetical protein
MNLWYIAGGAIVLYWVVRLAVGHPMRDPDRRQGREHRTREHQH